MATLGPIVDGRSSTEAALRVTRNVSRFDRISGEYFTFSAGVDTTPLDACLGDKRGPSLKRVRRFFELTQQHYKGGLYGLPVGWGRTGTVGLSEVFRRKIEDCISEIARRIAACLEEARTMGDIPPQSDTHGQPAGGLLGRRRASQPTARKCRAADHDARLLLPNRRNAPTAIVDRPRRTPDAVGSEYSPPPVEKA